MSNRALAVPEVDEHGLNTPVDLQLLIGVMEMRFTVSRDTQS